MNFFCGRWALALLIATGSAGAAGFGVMPELPVESRCTLWVSSPVVDYGQLSRWQLQEMPGGKVTLGRRSVTLSVACPYTQTIKLLVQGDASEHGGLRYGRHGYTRFRLLDAQLDGNPVELRPLSQAGLPMDTHGQVLPLAAGQRITPVVQGRLAEGKAFMARLEIQPVMTEDEARAPSRQRSESTLTLTLVN